MDESEFKFSLGQVVATANASETLSRSAIFLALDRHAAGDWGDVCEEDRQTNEAALNPGEPQRIMSVYKDGETVFWIITEWDRSVTTILLPEDY